MKYRAQPGLTLVELIASIAVIGIIAAVAGFSMGRIDLPTPSVPHERQLVETRSNAIRFRKTMRIETLIDGRPVAITALPDGRVLVDSLQVKAQ